MAEAAGCCSVPSSRSAEEDNDGMELMWDSGCTTCKAGDKSSVVGFEGNHKLLTRDRSKDGKNRDASIVSSKAGVDNWSKSSDRDRK
jgi:hypothetical protein